MSEAAGWVLIVVLMMLIGWNVWLDLRVQRLEDAVWHLLMQRVRDGLTEDA